MNISAIASHLNPPGASLTGKPDRSPAAQRQQVAAQFEAILVRQLLSQSVGSMLGGADHVSGTVYGDMMTDALAQKLTAGPGLGLGRMIATQLTPKGTPAAAPATNQTHP